MHVAHAAEARAAAITSRRSQPMSDRSSPVIFSAIFTKLANDPTVQHMHWAREFWRLQRDYDFHPGAMSCDDDLIALGLAKRSTDPDYPNTILYVELDYEDDDKAKAEPARQVMFFPDGRRKGSFRCQCGCNVFTVDDKGVFKCNGCQHIYEVVHAAGA